MITLHTKRLTFRPFQESDLQNLIDIDHDLEVMRYLGGKITPLEDLQKTIGMLIERQPKWKTYGTWCADITATNKNIGWFTFKPVPQINNEYEVGYRLKRKFWGNGYATEGAKFLVNYGFEKLNLPKIIGLTDLNNKASQHVLQKCGLVRVDDIVSPWPDFDGKIAKFEIKK